MTGKNTFDLDSLVRILISWLTLRRKYIDPFLNISVYLYEYQFPLVAICLVFESITSMEIKLRRTYNKKQHNRKLYSFKYNQQYAKLYNIIYYCQCYTCFGRFSAHHLEPKLYTQLITDLFYRLTQLFLLQFYPISGLGHYNPLYNDMFRPLYLAIIRFVNELIQ